MSSLPTGKRAARQRLIVADLEVNPAVRTSALARRLGVSSETVRRDIEELTRLGLVDRTYGGATGRRLSSQPVFDDRDALAVEERRRIAEAAVSFIQDGDVLMIDSGSTTARFAQALGQSGKRVSIITNSMVVANTIGAQPNVKVLLCPGEFSARERGVYGVQTLEFLKNYYADFAIIGASGLVDAGPTDVEPPAAWVKRTMLARAERRVLLLDSSKFGKRCFELVCPLEEITDLVTEQPPSGTLKERLGAAGVSVRLPAEERATESAHP